MHTTEPIRSKTKLRELSAFYLKRGELRNHLLIVLGIYTALRIGDLLRLSREDVYDYSEGTFRTHLHVIERKTGKSRLIALNKKAISALNLYFNSVSGESADPLFPNNRKNKAALGRVQAWRIIKKAAQAASVSGCIGCHSLRKTLGYHAWKSGVAAVLIMDIFNHVSFDVTRRYLGISQDDRDSVYLGLSLT